jgi:SPOR domain
MKVSRIITPLGVMAAATLLQACSHSGLYQRGSSTHWLYGRYQPQKVERRHVPIYEERGYHLTQGSSPTTHQQRDRQWIKTKPHQNYTIEVANDEKAAVVARKIHRSPRSSGTAQFQYQQNNKTLYTGVVGNYPSQEAAAKALEKFPAEIQKGAKIRQWEKIQEKIKPLAE